MLQWLFRKEKVFQESLHGYIMNELERESLSAKQFTFSRRGEKEKETEAKEKWMIEPMEHAKQKTRVYKVRWRHEMPLLFELPKGFILQMDGLGRGQKSWLGFHSNSPHRIPFHGFKKGRKWMDYIRIILFSVWEGDLNIGKIQGNIFFLSDNCISQIAVSTEDFRRPKLYTQ